MSLIGPPTIVILSANSGSGHAKAAEDLRRDLQETLKGWAIIHENVCDFSGGFLRWIIERLWAFVSVTPVMRSIYSYIYAMFVSNASISRFLELIFAPTAKSLSRRFKGSDIKIVVSFHPAASLSASSWNRGSERLLFVVCTDLIVHKFHDLDNVNCIYCDERATFLSQFPDGVNYGKLKLTGLPILYAEKLNTHKDKFDILVTFGASGLRGKENLDLILGFIATRQLTGVVVCGRNVDMIDKADNLIAKLNIGDRVRVVGHVENMSNLIASANVVIGKPGGLTAGEVIAHRKPFVIIDWLPGQEEYNAFGLVQSGIGFISERRTGSSGLSIAYEWALRPNVLRFVGGKKCGLRAIADDITSYATDSHSKKCIPWDRPKEGIAF